MTCGHFILYSQEDLNEWLNLRSDDAQQAEQLYLQWEDLKRKPIALNFCSRDELLQTGLLNIFQVHNLIQYREREGLIYSSKELALIKGFKPELIRALEPFLSFRLERNRLNLNRKTLWEQAEHQCYWRWQYRGPHQAVFREAGYRGDPLESRLRYHYDSPAGISLGFNSQKDPGEAWEGPLGYDHISYHLHYQGEGLLKQILWGDYQVQFGQGLGLWSGTAFNQSAIGANFNRTGRGIRAYAGNAENRFFRGLALDLKWRKWQSQIFYSMRKLDARTEVIKGQNFAKPIAGGYHRNNLERSRKDNLKLHSAGLIMNYDHQNLQFALLLCGHRFGTTPIPPQQYYETLSPPLQEYLLLAGEANYLWKGFYFSGEIAFDQDLDPALFLSWQKKLGDRLSVAQSLQHYNLQYQSFWSSPPARSGSSGEMSFSQQLDFDWSYQQRSQLKFNYHYFPWPRYQIKGPSTERQWQFLHRCKLQLGQIDLRLRYREEEKMDRSQSSREELEFQQNRQWQGRLILRHTWTTTLKSRTALQIKSQALNSIWTRGYMISQQWDYRPSSKSRYSFRLALSDLEDALGALYDYEPDLRFGFSIPALRGQSFRISQLAQWQKAKFGIEVKIVYLPLEKPSSYRFELKIQCRYRW